MTEIVRTRVARKVIDVAGIVQGVGFRPFVYRLANECGLTGLIANTPAGVSIEVQGEAEAVERFLERLPKEVPPRTKITVLAPREAELQPETEFRIAPSRMDAAARALISPDVSVCEDCLRELMNPRDRRFRYPFINCTNCGPRFTITRDIPYDRARTSMAKFKMCAACQAEYENPASRRFHAQPNACWDCGPEMGLLAGDGARMDAAEPIREAARLLQQGSVVAVKGLGGFHLACDAQNEKAVGKLRERKKRVEKPFAIMVRRVEDAARFCVMDELSKKVMNSFERPIVLLPRRQEARIAGGVAPGNRYLGVFLPYTPLHHLLFQSGKFEALVMTSGNLSEEPIAIDNEEAVRRLNGMADAFLVHDREIVRRCDDSVARVAAGQPQKLRRSRGFVPVPVQLEKGILPVLAVGGELKNTVCVVRGSEAFLSQHVGDLENLEGYRFFEEAVQHLQRILRTEPKVIAHDLHPDYFSTKWAQERAGVELVGVQHHHAHVAACMADYVGFERAGHFEYVPLPGGAAAIHEPWRMAVSYLVKHYGKNVKKLGLPFLAEIDSRKLSVVLQMMEREINSPRTSSCGRLFDAVAALVGLRGVVNFEAQAAIELEMAARDSGSEAAYPLDLDLRGTTWQIGTKPLFDWLLKDIRQQASVADMSRKFHNALAIVLVDTAERIRDRTGLNRVCLSGGCFLNTLLLETTIAEMKERVFQVYFHTEVPAGDGGISLGQAVIAGSRVGS